MNTTVRYGRRFVSDAVWDSVFTGDLYGTKA
jgi:hypothetical protein